MVISDEQPKLLPERVHGQLLGRLRLKHLRLAQELAKSGSLRRAASNMNVSQPAATKILQDLEDLLGIQICERQPRSIKLNELGEFVSVYARRVLVETERFAGQLCTLSNTGHGTVSVGAIMVSAAKLLPSALKVLKRERPGISVRVEEASSDRLLSDLLAGKHDFVIARFTKPSDELNFDMGVISEEPLCLFMSSESPDITPTSLAELHHLQWVIQESPAPARHLLEIAFAREQLPLPPQMVQTNSVYVTLNMVRTAGFVGLLPRDMVQNEGGRFRTLPLTLADTLRPYGIVTRRGVELTSEARDLIDILLRSSSNVGLADGTA